MDAHEVKHGRIKQLHKMAKPGISETNIHNIHVKYGKTIHYPKFQRYSESVTGKRTGNIVKSKINIKMAYTAANALTLEHKNGNMLLLNTCEKLPNTL